MSAQQTPSIYVPEKDTTPPPTKALTPVVPGHDVGKPLATRTAR